MKRHAVDDRDAAWLAAAVEYTASVHVNGESYVVRCATLAEAGKAGQRIENTLRSAGPAYSAKRAIVYACTAQGHATMVPRDQWTKRPI